MLLYFALVVVVAVVVADGSIVPLRHGQLPSNVLSVKYPALFGAADSFAILPPMRCSVVPQVKQKLQMIDVEKDHYNLF